MEADVVRLEYHGKEIILVAAAHVLKQSAFPDHRLGDTGSHYGIDYFQLHCKY